jgi:hypothetical protein
MTFKELETRLAALEKAVAELQIQAANQGNHKEPWWRTQAGRFADDPGFEEMARLGREYRESLHPGRGPKRRVRKPKDARSGH